MANLGSLITWSGHFENSSGVDADPSLVTFRLREHIDGTELVWIYSGSPVEGTNYPTGMSAMVKDSTGDYHVPFTARKTERHAGFWTGPGTVCDSPAAAAFVRHPGIEALEAT